MYPVVLIVSSCLVASVNGLHITWLPLGDSITWGCGNGILPHVKNGCERDAGSYRIPVAQALEQWNITTTTVGSLTAGPTSSPAVGQHHEGHPGWTIEQVASISAQWTKTKPDVITIHLGTNDNREPSASAVASLRALLGTIDAALPTADVFVASILRMPAAHASFVSGFNAAAAAVRSSDGERSGKRGGRNGKKKKKKKKKGRRKR